MDIVITDNARAYVRELRRVRRKAIGHAIRETCNDMAMIAARDIERQYKSKYDPKIAGGKRLLNAPRRPSNKRPTTSDKRGRGGLMFVSRAFVLANGKISKPAVVYNIASDEIVNRLLHGSRKKTAGGKRVVVPKRGRRRVPSGATHVIKSGEGYWKFKTGRRLRGGGHRKTNYLGSLVQETKHIPGRLSGSRAIGRASRAGRRLFERNVRREVREFRTRERLRTV